MESIAACVLNSLNVAVLQRLGEREYHIVGEVPEFYLDIFSSGDKTPSNEPWNYSIMLDFFFEDSELFFERNLDGILDSGIWQESGLSNINQSLTASAIIKDGKQLLTIRLLEKDFVRAMSVLQKAREAFISADGAEWEQDSRENGYEKDMQTGLISRKALDEILEKKAGKIMGLNIDLSLILVHLDDFNALENKDKNLADRVLKKVASFLEYNLRKNDIIIRYDKDIFALIVPEGSPIQTYMLAEKLRSEAENLDQEDLPYFTFSIGCTSFVCGEELSVFTQRAELALFEALKEGKNSVKVR